MKLQLTTFRPADDSMQGNTKTLLHETLAHFGINLLAPNGKSALLADIIAAKSGNAAIGENILIKSIMKSQKQKYF